MQEENAPVFKEKNTSKIGNLMGESTEVVDVDDVIKYSQQANAQYKNNLVPYVIYMDADFNNMVRAEKKKNAVILLFKILGVLLVVMAIIFLISWLIKK
ncbi:hypothetical protein G9O61_00g008040 [Vairimorpha ceranae]|nr:hypothetical protein G9O61_00g009720 [Vairimorpha ceranae]KAF5141020.1 hypothetical protein G9O61_00g008040 [Vairimorpha ceranae]